MSMAYRIRGPALVSAVEFTADAGLTHAVDVELKIAAILFR
jgi:hypothetical protein